MIHHKIWNDNNWELSWSVDSKTHIFKLPMFGVRKNQKLIIHNNPSYEITFGEICNKGFYKILKEIEDFYTKNSTEVSIRGKDYKNLYFKLYSFYNEVEDYFEFTKSIKRDFFKPIIEKFKK